MAVPLAVPDPISKKDEILQSIVDDAMEMRGIEPILSRYVERVVLGSRSLTAIIGNLLAAKLGGEIIEISEFEELFSECLANENSFSHIAFYIRLRIVDYSSRSPMRVYKTPQYRRFSQLLLADFEDLN